MKKKILLLVSTLSLVSVFPVHAEESKEISELKIEIQKKEDELKELKSKLNDLTNEQGYSINETFDNEDFELTIDFDVKKRIDLDYSYFEADGVYVAVFIKFKNISNSAKKLDGSGFKLVLDDATYSSINLIGQSLSYETLNPGIEKEGYVYFDVPSDTANSNELILKYEPNISSNGKQFEIKLAK